MKVRNSIISYHFRPEHGGEVAHVPVAEGEEGVEEEVPPVRVENNLLSKKKHASETMGSCAWALNMSPKTEKRRNI